jgi:hypothetical protein
MFAWMLGVVLWMLVALLGTVILLALAILRWPLKLVAEWIEQGVSDMLLLVLKARPSTDRWKHIEVRP